MTGPGLIVTVTPNPSLDRTVEVDRLVPGAVIRASSLREDPGGKGVNVARALVVNGVAACAVLPLGGRDGRLLADLLDEQGLTYRPVPVNATTRCNIAVSDARGTVTKLNTPGAGLSADDIARLVEATAAELPGAAWLVGCGSLPAGAPVDLFATLAERARHAGVRVAVDTSGPPLAAALEAGVDLVKPNLAELCELVGRPLATLDDVVAAADGVRKRGAAAVLVSLGAAGAVLVDDGEPWLAVPPPVIARSDVGAGDVALAGFLAAGAAGREALRNAVAWGAAAVSLPGTVVPGPERIDAPRVSLRPACGTQPLSQPPPA
ncbi:MAG: 1-phosphofructokinase [Acidimicrobiales bacterium]